MEKVDWDSILARKNEFIGGQVEMREGMTGGRGFISRGQVADIVKKGAEVSIRLEWCAYRAPGDRHWTESIVGSIGGYVTDLTIDDDGGHLFGIVYISGVHSLYPKGHPSNISRESVSKA